MSTLYKEYIQMPESAKSDVAGKLIKFSVSFNKDSTNWATYKPQPIGYRVTVVPVSRTDMGNGIVMEEFGAFTGFNDTLLEVGRQSKKRLEEALRILQERKDKYMLYFVKTTETI